MKKFALILFAILSLCVPAMAQTIGTATITAQGNFTVPPGATLSLNVQLIGCNSTTPLYNSFPISITPNQTPGAAFVANGSGSVTFTVPGNDAVICGGQNYTRYALTWKINGLPVAPTQSYRFLENTTQALSTITPVEFVPPILNNAFNSVCPSGQILTGYNTQYIAQCVPIPVGAIATTSPTFTVTSLLNSANTISKLPRSDVRYSDFSIGTYIIGANVVGGSGCSNPQVVFSSPPTSSASVQATGIVNLNLGGGISVQMTNDGAGYSTAFASITGCSVAPTVTPIMASCSGSGAGPGIESTCNVQQAFDFASSSFKTSVNPAAAPAVSIPAGDYIVGTNQALRMPCGLTVIGDGANTTILHIPAGSANNGLTVFQSGGVPTSSTNWSCTGGIENLAILGGGHTTTGNLLELDGTTGFKVTNGRFENTGGRCVQLSGETERTHFIGTLQVSACRWSMIYGGEQDKVVVDHLLLQAPGLSDNGNYDFGVNQVGGVRNTSGVMFPNRQCGIFFSGANAAINGGMADSLQSQCGIQMQGAGPITVKNMYFEGGVNGALNSSLQLGGRMYFTTSTGAMGTNQYGTFLPTTPNSFTAPDYMPSLVTDPQDVPQNIGVSLDVMISCPDFVWGSVTPCAGNAAIQQGQYEIARGMKAGDSNFYLGARNLGGFGFLGASTAPANSSWPAGSQIQYIIGPTVGAATYATNIFQAINGASGVYSPGCDDTNPELICAEILAGPEIGYGHALIAPTPGHAGPNAFAVPNSIYLDNTDIFTSTNELLGNDNWIKNTGRLNMAVTGISSNNKAQYGGDLLSGTEYNIVNSWHVRPIQLPGVTAAPPLSVFTMNTMNNVTDTSYYNSTIHPSSGTDAITGPNRTGGQGTLQYYGGYCLADTPPGNITTTTSLSSSTTVVTVIANNLFVAGEWITFGVITNSNTTTVNFTSPLGLLLNGTSVQVATATSTQYTFNFANAGFGSVSDVGTAAPHADYETCSVGAPTAATTGFEVDFWNGTSYTQGPAIILAGNKSGFTFNVPTNSSVALSSMGQTGANAFAGKCTMAAGTSCTATLGHTYTTPVCIATQQATTLTGASTGCTVAGTTVTVTSSIANSEVWGFMVIGDPN